MKGFLQIWEGHQTGRQRGEHKELWVDMVFAHEATLSLILPELRAAGGPALPVDRLFFVLDHFAPPSSGPFADIVREVRSFCAEHSIPLQMLEGIGHRLMMESDRIRPGDLVIGADSHTTTIGGKGAAGIGLGSTDVLSVLLTGRVWLRRPLVAAICLTGALPAGVEARDAAMSLLRHHGQAGFLGQVMEYRLDETTSLEPDERSVLTNLCVEMGAVTALAIESSSSAPADRQVAINLNKLTPLVAQPGAPDDVVPAETLSDIRPDWVIIGSCAAGSLDDLHRAAVVLDGRQVAEGVGLLVTPGSNRVYKQAMADGTLRRLVDAGATILNPSCGACGGIDKGIPAVDDVVLSTAPRNYASRQRAGSRVYLASASVAAATALTGRIADPREVLS
ncbi:MAG: hypothetical protein ISR64_06010 [Deltaproteobacteria bacterium]|nr:hypothetical protein [Deltaproteobacteria bacterium]